MKRGKTPVLSAEEARKPLDSIESNTLIGLRDRALIGTMVYSFARVGATVTMRVGDYFSAPQTVMAQVARKRRQAPRGTLPSESRGVLERLGRGGRHRARQERAAVSQYEQGRQADRQSDDAVRRAAHDQASRPGRRPALLHVLSHFPCDRHHHIS